MDISEVIAPDSDEMVAADLIGSPPRTFTITEVSEASREGKRVADVRLEGFPRPWRPGKGMSRVMADNWGAETQVWIGRRVELYGDPDVYFGKEKTGGVRISRLSHITQPKTTRTNPRGGKNGTWTVQPLPDALPLSREQELLAEYGTATPERQAEIKAEVEAIRAGGAPDA